MNIPKAYSMTSPSGHSIVANQIVIRTGTMDVFQSYNTTIAIRQNGEITLDRNSWDYSTTTGKYRNQFLGEDKEATRKKIESGEYKLANLNA